MLVSHNYYKCAEIYFGKYTSAIVCCLQILVTLRRCFCGIFNTNVSAYQLKYVVL